MRASTVVEPDRGARLFLSPKTIEVHLSRAYRKLDVRTRTELARRLAIDSAPVEPAPVERRSLAAILFTDIVRSTDRAVSLGDQQWSVVLSHHDRTIGSAVDRAGGRVIKSTGDGVLAMFDAASSALTCAVAIRRALEKLGIDVRAAIHVGEVDRMPDGDIRGIAVHVAARALGQADAGGIVATRAAQETARGSSFSFRSRGQTLLKGVGSVELFHAAPRDSRPGRT